MTFKEWTNTSEGEASFTAACERADGDQGIYIDNLMWSDYKDSEDWQLDQFPHLMKEIKVPEDINLLAKQIKTQIEVATFAIQDLQLRDAKDALKNTLDSLKGFAEISEALEKKGIKQK